MQDGHFQIDRASLFGDKILVTFEVSAGSGSATNIHPLAGGGASATEIHLRADEANGAPVRVGDSTVTTTGGIQLAPGDYIKLVNTRFDVHVIAESGTQNVTMIGWLGTN